MSNHTQTTNKNESEAVKEPDKLYITDKLGVTKKCKCGNRQFFWDVALTELENIINIQCQSGTWNYNPYQLGLANGLLLAFGILTGRQPQYLSPPKQWIEDQKKHGGIILPSNSFKN